jgi:hypothetical protein
MNETESSRDEAFWQEVAASVQSLPSTVPTGNAGAAGAELDELLLRYAAGELNREEESQLRRLSAQYPDLAVRMAQAFQAVRDVAAAPAGSAARIWSRGTAAPSGYSAPERLVDLAVRLLAEGLELIRSAGRPAYPALATRSSSPAPPLSVAQEFLTSAGIVDVIVDFRDAATWQLVARSRLLPSSVAPRGWRLRLCDAHGAVRGDGPLNETGLIIESLPPGEYELILAEGEQERSRLRISCLPPENSV